MSLETDLDAPTLVPSRAPAAQSPRGSRVEGRNTSLPAYSEAGLVERRVDRYQVLKTLGAGGMGEVALVRDHDIDRHVAVKFLHSELAEPALVARFVEEIRNVGQLEHPNIVPIHDAGKDEAGRYFFVMKHVEGQTLETIIERLRAGDPQYVRKYTHLDRVQIFLAILNALQFAHEKGFIHRDLKPANVMVGPHGEVVVMDWGLSKSVKSAACDTAGPVATHTQSGRLIETQYGAVMGTPMYMSPEQACGRTEEVDARSDLYSATVLFHELLFLEHYLEGRESMPDIIAGVQNVGMKPYLEYTRFPRPPSPYGHILRKGMAKNPGERFQSAAEMADAIRTAMDGQAPMQCMGTFMRRGATELTRLVDRRPGAAMLLYGLLAASVVTSVATAVVLLTRLL